MENEQLTRDGTQLNPSRETKLSGAKADMEISIFPIQLTTSKIIDNLTRLTHITLLYVMTINTYIYSYIIAGSTRYHRTQVQSEDMAVNTK